MGEFPAEPAKVSTGWIQQALQQNGLLANGNVTQVDRQPIKTGTRRIIQYLLSPISQAMSEAGRER